MQNIKVKDIISCLEEAAPPSFQEDYDNSGLQVGDYNADVSGILITLDVTPEIVEEAHRNNCNLIISHHPVTLSGIKKMTGNSFPVQILTEAIRNNISIYAAHTNIDSVKNGVSGILAKKLDLINCEILFPRKNLLLKLVTFVPNDYADKVRNAIFEAEAGHVGNYDCCSYNIEGEGTFRGDDSTNPFVGEKGKPHTEKEVRIETIVPDFLKNAVLKALLETHPYEEPAYDFYMLENSWDKVGFGIIGELKEAKTPTDFLKYLKSVTQTGCIRYTQTSVKQIKRVALCGGSGSFLLQKALNAKADVFISGDFKYHQFFETSKGMMIADIGHYESEQFTKELFFEIVTKKFPNFAVRLSEINSNPIKYY